jgi:hypothetical protein
MEYCKPVVLTWNEVNKGNFHAEGDSKLLLILRVSANLKKKCYSEPRLYLCELLLNYTVLDN